MAIDPVWRLEQHVCRVCFGRILSRPVVDVDDRRVYRCADCGVEQEGAQARVLCACGVKLNARNAAIRCEPNERRTPEFPFEICAKQA